MRGGNEAAFSVAFERHATGLLGFCRHMVGSPEDAEDAVQHTFLAAFRDLARSRDRELALKPWLYAIARNRCLSILRARREQTGLDFDLPTEGLTEQVERRAELRELLRDLRELPEEQRAALLLTEAGNLSHAEVAGVLDCEVAKVKALVFSARSGLIQRREARETACAEIREQLANLRGNSLRRNGLRHHLRHCDGCRAYSEQVKRQRGMLAAALPVVLSPGLRSSLRAGAGLGGGSWGGGLAAGLGTGLSASAGAGTLVKVAAVGLIVGGAATSGGVLIADAERMVVPSPMDAAPATLSSRPKPSPARVIAGRPIPDSVRKAGAPLGSFDTWAQEQGSDSVPPSASRPDGEQAPGQEHDASAAPSGDGARERDQAGSHGDDADTVGSAPGGRRPTMSPSSGMTAYGGPAPGKGGPRSDDSSQGGPPSGTRGKAEQPSGPPGAPAYARPAEGSLPGRGTPEPKPDPEQRPPATAADPVPGAAPGSHPPPAPGPPEKSGQQGSWFPRSVGDKNPLARRG